MQRTPEPIRNLVLTTILSNPKMPYKDIAKTFGVSLSLVKAIATEAKVGRKQGYQASTTMPRGPRKGWKQHKAVVNG